MAYRRSRSVRGRSARTARARRVPRSRVRTFRAGTRRASPRAQVLRIVVQGDAGGARSAYNPAGQLVFPGDAIVTPKGSKF